MKESQKKFIKMLDEARTTRKTFIPNYLERVNNAFNIVKGRFILLGSTSGAGKSTFVDDVFILKPWANMIRHGVDFHYEVLYYSMERAAQMKISRWVSWLLYHDNEIVCTTDDMFKYKSDEPISDELYELIRSKDAEVQRLLDHVHIYDGKITGDVIRRQVAAKALKLGTLYVTDDVGLFVQTNSLVHTYIKTFVTSGQIRKNSLGEDEEVIEAYHNGETFTLARDQHAYFPNNPNTYFLIVMDGLGLVKKSKGENTKTAVDDVVEALQECRDIYGMTPILISQFNRAIVSVDRAKHYKSDLAPNQGDFKDTGNAYQAADLVLALFDPHEIKAYDARGFYGGYDLTNGLTTPYGECRFRSLHMLKNTYGIKSGVYGLNYFGAMAYYETLPPVGDPKLEIIYTKTTLGIL